MNMSPVLRVLDESKNPYGTWKDRRSEYIVQKALKKGISKLCLITSGNAGYSLAKCAAPHGIKVSCVVDVNLKKEIKQRLTDVAHKVIETSLDDKVLTPEEVITLVREDEEDIWDVTNGYMAAFTPLAKELSSKEPNYLICPLGSGEAFVGLHQGLIESNSKTILVGVGVEAKHSFADKLSCSWRPYDVKIDEILAEGHIFLKLSEEEVREAYEEYKDLYTSEPSATVVWAALKKLELKPDDKVILINSGKGVF
jgi:threonine synthase